MLGPGDTEGTRRARSLAIGSQCVFFPLEDCYCGTLCIVVVSDAEAPECGSPSRSVTGRALNRRLKCVRMDDRSFCEVVHRVLDTVAVLQGDNALSILDIDLGINLPGRPQSVIV